MNAVIKASKKEGTGIRTIVLNSIKNKDSAYRVAWLILGGKDFAIREPISIIEYVSASEKGVPKLSLENLATILRIPMKDIAVLLNVSFKTLSRKSKKDLLDPLGSSLSIELANLTAKGLAVFEDDEKFNRWLQKENRALHSKKPFDLLNTPTGLKLVNQILERIEEGVYT